MAKHEKMSKSRGNVVTPEEVIDGVADLGPGYYFRDEKFDRIDDWQSLGIWRDRLGSGFYYTSSLRGRRPVFLCREGEIGAPGLLIRGEPLNQHGVEWQPTVCVPVNAE